MIELPPIDPQRPELLKLIAGDPEAQARFYRAHVERLRGLAEELLGRGREVDAADLVAGVLGTFLTREVRRAKRLKAAATWLELMLVRRVAALTRSPTAVVAPPPELASCDAQVVEILRVSLGAGLGDAAVAAIVGVSSADVMAARDAWLSQARNAT